MAYRLSCILSCYISCVALHCTLSNLSIIFFSDEVSKLEASILASILAIELYNGIIKFFYL